MASKKQIAANRRNAKKSTGPKTPDGKEKSRMNAMTHGLCSRQVLLKEEDPDVFREVWMGVFEDLRPEGEVETYLACRVASGIWRMNRVARIEAQLFNDSPQRTIKPEVSLGEIYKFACLSGANPFGRLHRYESAIDRGILRALKELRSVQAARGAREERVADEVSETLYRRRMEEALLNRGGATGGQAASPAAPEPANGKMQNEPNGAEVTPPPSPPRARGGVPAHHAAKGKARNEPNPAPELAPVQAYGGNGTALPHHPAPAGK